MFVEVHCYRCLASFCSSGFAVVGRSFCGFAGRLVFFFFCELTVFFVCFLTFGLCPFIKPMLHIVTDVSVVFSQEP